MADTRLIERWLPIAEIGVESTRERTPMTPFPAPNRLHVWWARRPLVASRAAVLASLLPADADRDRFLHVLGIHGDPVAAKRRISAANRTGERLGAGAYGYPRAFGYIPDDADRIWLHENAVRNAVVLDPTAGGGSVPFESVRAGLYTVANDLNPVAALIERATVEWPARFGASLRGTVEELGERLTNTVRERLAGVFPEEPREYTRPDGYLWARTVTCPYCDGLVPLSPNWRLAPGGTGVRLTPHLGGGPGSEGRTCTFEVVDSAAEQSPGTVSRGAGDCPYTDCGRIIDGDVIKAQAQAGRMGEQLYAVVYKERVEVRTKTGRIRKKWVRGYRAPRPEDDNGAAVRARLDEKLPEWEAFDLVPSETVGAISNYDRGHKLYGMNKWTDLFSPRQLLCHGTSVEVFREMLDADRAAGLLDETRKAAYGYLALTLDTLLNYNNRAGRWDNTTGRVRSIFDRHGFAFVWSYAEMVPLVAGVGYDWAVEKTAKCIAELVALVRPDAPARDGDLFDGTDHTGRAAGGKRTEHSGVTSATPPTPVAADSTGHAAPASRGGPDDHGDDSEAPRRSARTSGLPMATQPTRQTEATKQDLPPPPITITCKPGDSLDHLGDASIDVVVMDPPYYDNVMYAELSDFFYVWLKRTAGHVFPELFRRQLTDKENEAVANPAKFRGEKGARALAGQDYRERMAAIFAECRRVLKADGIMTLMFTHKATGAWDALTKGLIESGFVITASWPINTEAEGSLHIKDKAAANSTIFLVCRPRAEGRSGSAAPGEPGEAGRDGAAHYPEQIAPARASPDRIDRSEAGPEGADRLPERIAPARALDPIGRSGAGQSQDATRARHQVGEEPAIYGPTDRPRTGPGDPDERAVQEAPGVYTPAPQDAPDLYWEDVEPRVARAVRARVGEFQDAGIAGVDLYLASFGPALEEFSRHWPLKRGTPREPPAERRRRRQQVLLDDEAWDPYATTPEDALDAARREVKRWRLEQLTHLKADADLDPATAFFVLAWDAFRAPAFSYDEALRFARAVGIDLDGDIVDRLAKKKGSNLHLWDSAQRAAKGALGPPDGSQGMIDAIHRAAHVARTRSLQAARELLAEAQTDKDPRFFAALEAVLEVLPVSRAFTGIDVEGEAAAAGDDFEALYNLARLAYRDEVGEPEQLKLWREDG